MESAIRSEDREWLLRRRSKSVQKDDVALAKDDEACRRIGRIVVNIPTSHKVICGDSRQLGDLISVPVHAVITSPPYWTLKEYPDTPGQLGHTDDYGEFVACLDVVWKACFDALVPGGHLIIVVGDVCRSAKIHGYHEVRPLHASILTDCLAAGYIPKNTILWHKVTSSTSNRRGNVDGGFFFGSPYQPLGIVKNEVEYILCLKKPGKRSVAPLARRLSLISNIDYYAWYRQIWEVGGTGDRSHPAPYPLEIPGRLVRMFSFVGDTVLDPFCGTGTTLEAASVSGRHSIGIDIEPEFVRVAEARTATKQLCLGFS